MLALRAVASSMSRCMASQSRKIAAVTDGLVIEPLLKQVGAMGVCECVST